MKQLFARLVLALLGGMAGNALALPVSIVSNNPGTALYGLAASGSTFWAGAYNPGGGSFVASGVSGGALSALPGATSPCCVVGLTLLGSDIYWIDPNGDPDATAIFKVAAAGGVKTKIYSGFATGQPIVDGSGIATDGARLYTADYVQGRVHSLNPDGSAITQIGGNRYGGFFFGEHYNAIAVGGGNIYVADSGSSAVGQTPGIYTHSASATSGGFATLVSGLPFSEGGPRGIAYGAGNLYVTQGNTIYSIAAGGGPLTAISDPLFHNLEGIAYDAGSLYVTDNSGGSGRVLQIGLTTVPEPATLALLGLGFLGILTARTKKFSDN